MKPKNVPLTLLLPNNTRKWSGTYLMISRLLRLQDVLDILRENFTELPSLIWNDLKEVQSILFQFYLREQILQRDSSSAIHSSHFWEELKVMSESAANSLNKGMIFHPW